MITFNVPDNLCSFILPLVKLKVKVKHLNNETTVSDSEYWVSNQLNPTQLIFLWLNKYDYAYINCSASCTSYHLLFGSLIIGSSTTGVMMVAAILNANSSESSAAKNKL